MQEAWAEGSWGTEERHNMLGRAQVTLSGARKGGQRANLGASAQDAPVSQVGEDIVGTGRRLPKSICNHSTKQVGEGSREQKGSREAVVAA
jgi:hypothetical protein